MPSTINADNGVASGSAGLKSTADSSGVLQLQTNGTTAVTVDTSQNVGVGTASPGTKLNVYTGSATNTIVRVANTAGSIDFGVLSTGEAYGGYGNNTVYFGTSSASPAVFYTNATERMRIDSSGNLGLGVTPSAWQSGVKVFQIGTYGGIEENSGGGGGIALFGNAHEYSTNAYKYLQSYYATLYRTWAGQHQWFTAPSGTAGNVISFTQAMTLDASGNLLVGTTSTGGGTERIVCSVTGGVKNGFLALATDTATAAALVCRNNSNTSVGTITFTTTATSYNTSSDYRLKENIQPMTGALERVAQLKPCTYTWKATGVAGQGFIAHELQAVVPEAVSGEKDAVNKDGSIKPQGIDTSFLVATLTAAIQELKAEVDSLKSQLAAKG